MNVKKGILAISIILAVVVGLIILYTLPRNVSRTLTGVEYQLGTNRNKVVPVKITLHGKLQRSLNGHLKYRGSFVVTGGTVPNPDNQRTADIHFDSNGQGLIVYGYWTKAGTPVNHIYGAMFMTDAFKTLTIEAFTPAGSNNKSWNGGDGFMITAPAQTRSQALSISNELMKKNVDGTMLK
ncbi:hypothetical protein [Alicyclobacillus sp. ALC3]|uniref:hypothetical protein n=1 Tax=Alicyclobacillus sp. ALC3 TaxID=2796143 RepID=UPI002378D5A3|nr:hypothetical protein [Alicyclobacillus sp. ALC3]WDL95897.1 hypothetical protein JC200_16270 [Alicyclobacillus sp. ALC3]